MVPHYSREYQDTIVKRLDKITHLISMRTRQLDKLDELVKSRFILGDLLHKLKLIVQGGKHVQVETW